jgi:hypothetical protein
MSGRRVTALSYRGCRLPLPTHHSRKRATAQLRMSLGKRTRQGRTGHCTRPCCKVWACEGAHAYSRAFTAAPIRGIRPRLSCHHVFERLHEAISHWPHTRINRSQRAQNGGSQLLPICGPNRTRGYQSSPAVASYFLRGAFLIENENSREYF